MGPGIRRSVHDDLVEEGKDSVGVGNALRQLSQFRQKPGKGIKGEGAVSNEGKESALLGSWVNAG